MSKIMEVRGAPPKEVIKSSTRRDINKFFTRTTLDPIMTYDSKGNMRVPGSKSLRELIRTKDRDFVDFIDVSELVFVFIVVNFLL